MSAPDHAKCDCCRAPTRDEIKRFCDERGCLVMEIIDHDDDVGFLFTGHARDDAPVLLAVNIERRDISDVAGLMTSLVKKYRTDPVLHGHRCLCSPGGLVLTALVDDEAAQHARDSFTFLATEYRRGADYDVVVLLPTARLSPADVTNEEARRDARH
jgi:hypothetical protein